MQRHSRRGIAGKAARTRIHRADQHEAGREDGRARRARDRDAPLFERLAQHLEHVPAELRHLVEEEHAVMGEADLAGPRLRSAADERRVRDRVVRRAKRTLGDEPRVRRQQTGHRMHGGDLQRLVEGQRRQDPGQPPRHHRLAGTGRTDQQQVVAAGAGDLERAAREELAADVGEIGAHLAAAGGRAGTTAAAGDGWFSASTASASDDTGRTSSPSTTAASLALARGSSTPGTPSRRAAAAIGSTPRAG